MTATGMKAVGMAVDGINALRKGRGVAKTARNWRQTHQFWTKSTTFRGQRVYQRDDIIDPGFVGPDGRTNFQRMREGLAPYGTDGKKVELHHLLQEDGSDMAEVLSTFHSDYKQILHINPQGPTGVNRSVARSFREGYWAHRAKDFE